MIIGHGDIARSLVKADRTNYTFFASGVSNSQETREAEFRREKELFAKQPKYKHMVYFSSLCIFYSRSRYAKHKRAMEEFVRGTFETYTIFRLGNITWGKNPHTIINYFKNERKAGRELHIKNVYRYLVTKNEFLHWVNMIPEWSCEMNITGRKILVKNIIKEYVDR